VTVQSGRYLHKPLVRLLECYVLWAIDKLHPGDEVQLAELGPRIAALYEVKGNWHEVVATVMDLPWNMGQIVRQYWRRDLAQAEENGETLEPQRFAEMFVDAYLT
jgi:hypothetical protein